MNRPPSPLHVALQFLTRLPLPGRDRPSASTVGRSLLYYPVAGLVIGLLLAASGWLLAPAPPPLQASLLLLLWVVLTGALHLDGLADTADAWVGGMGDRQRTLEILKDPRSGPMGVAAVVVTLLAKYSALQALATTEHWEALIAVPVLARGTLLWLFLSTPYVRPGGLGEALRSHLPRRGALAVGALVPLLVSATGGLAGTVVVTAALLLFLLLRRSMLRRLGGTTGDTAGALVEMSETLSLLLLGLLLS